jgi:undecaprenyl pyrophosphate synthase
MEELCYSLGVLALAPLWILSLSTLAVAVMLAKGMTGAALFKTKVTKCRTEDETRLQLQNRASSMPPPRHVAVIMDGNRRYGRAKYGDPIRGHADGGTTLGHFAKWCSEEGVQMLTAYAFSTENWNRDESEVNALMEILWRYCRDFMEEAKERDVKIKVLVSTYEKVRSICACSAPWSYQHR